MKLILLLLILPLFGCQFLDGLHQFRSGQVSPPAYPAYIADEPALWHEGGHVYRFDKTGMHELK